MGSMTLTVKLHVPVLPAASVALQVTVVVVPLAKLLPLGGEQVGVKVPSQLSVAVAV
jgi:hypothetical protein